MPPFDTVLVANRGEVALRIMRTLKKMNIKAVAVYSEADANALHVQYADEAHYIGSSPATKSYLSIPNVLKAVRNSGAQAVHPGYGFLSENPKFAHILARGGVALIGPSAKAIKNMGDKVEAKRIAAKAGVNAVPGYIGIIPNSKQAVKIAEEIGFPVIVKAAAGGGGRGMRVVCNAAQMIDAFESAQIEAASNFNDSRVFIEKFILDSPRHIEIQVLADKHGNVVCLGERECSIQRSHQKVIEETPSTFISEGVREQMYLQSKSLAKEVNYYSAGTVEFIVDGKGNFYFLEMNTRLQVEHAVTELVTGVDIVEEMVNIAAGKELSIKQEDIKLDKWAIECRICAEDPSRGFLPSSGRITDYREPPRSANIRIDTSIDSGAEASMYYDTLIAKLCTVGENRSEAIAHMKHALSSFVIRGINHNIPFLEALITHPRFASGDISTNFITEEYPKGFAGAELTSEISQIFVATAIYIFMAEQTRMSLLSERAKDRADKIMTRWVVSLDGALFPIIIKPVTSGYNIRQGSNKISIRSDWTIGNRLFSCQVNGKGVYVKVEHIPTGYKLVHAGVTAVAYVRSPKVSELERHMLAKNKVIKEREILAPLGGQVVSVRIKDGDEVKEGQEIISLIAMKMENIIRAPNSGKIKKVHVCKDQVLQAGSLMAEYE